MVPRRENLGNDLKPERFANFLIITSNDTIALSVPE